ncbi:hypothetical protein BKH41_02680 [Helicobacter sp. 12S02232-10]|uniref:MFS transporter n=1 Tax=Helicobacter sp. 12S02232-10 TaxID=1476197 RepID=UPI000BA579B6|nr:MFS transporter [Helicobacter sp. 12S02232-10]PAF49588.1 hypothetical protein BKH41_02680 [Helicobacter sp. 12S02232-10]
MKNMKLLNFLLAFACGAMVANLYYTQPILANIADSLNIPIKDIAMITTITQIGYALGMFFVVPLLDVLENKKLIIFVMILCIVSYKIEVRKNLEKEFRSA